jgi:hypothetical protein
MSSVSSVSKLNVQNIVLRGLADVKNWLCFYGHTVASASEISGFRLFLFHFYVSKNQHEPFYMNMRSSSM